MIDPAKKAFSFAEEFKAFALKGNVIDMAVGVVIGAGFTGLIKSMVDNIINPLISIVMPSNQHFTAWELPVLAHRIPVGKFLGDIVNFVILALVLFIFVVKILGFLMRSRTEAPPPPLTTDQNLLTEIRDLLKEQQTK
jgi:large conductance mechanosensitive channel